MLAMFLSLKDMLLQENVFGCFPTSIIALVSSPLEPKGKFNITSNISANMMCANRASECCLAYFWLYK